MNGDERGVSEVIAFVLVFAIIIGSVGLLYVVGFDSMQSYQEAEQVRNAERAMSALGENMNDVQRAGIHERSSELELRGGRVSVVNDTTLHVSGVSDPIHTGGIRYERGSTHISYEAGGVFSGVVGDRNQTVVVDPPTLTCNPDRATAVISVFALEGEDGTRSISGDSGVELTVVENPEETTTQIRDNLASNVTVEVDSDFQNGWKDAWVRNGWHYDESTGYAECAAETVTIRIVDADVEF